MAISINTLKKRIESCNKNIAKFSKSVERYQKAYDKAYSTALEYNVVDKTSADLRDTEWIDELLRRDSFTALFDYEHATDNLKSAQSNLKEWQEKLANYQTQYKTVQKENDIPVIPALEEFLENWRKVAYEYYMEQYKDLVEWLKWYRKYRDEQYEEMKAEGWDIYSSKKEACEERARRQITDRYMNEYIKEHFAGVSVEMYNKCRYNHSGDDLTVEERIEEYLTELLAKEVDKKRIALFNRCKKVVGNIMDASNLQLGDNGFINGIVIGEDGKCFVETIGAGGYNIQCFHYRVLVKVINNLN